MSDDCSESVWDMLDSLLECYKATNLPLMLKMGAKRVPQLVRWLALTARPKLRGRSKHRSKRMSD